jgi:hypothetical protein
MKKPLHGGESRYYSFKNGELIVWGAHDVVMLLEAANEAPKFEVVEKGGLSLLAKNGVVVPEVSPEDSFCVAVNDWMNSLFRDGVTDELIDDLNQHLADVRYVQVLEPLGRGAASWRYNIADMNGQHDPVEAAAYAFSNQLAIGSLAKLRRCQLADCQKFFLGPPNAKWCSASCGSKNRVRRKRKRDKQ